MSSKILNYEVYSKEKEELLRDIFRSERKQIIISGNPEVLNAGLQNEEIKKIFSREGSVIIPDGIGVVIASKIVRSPVKEKIAGIEVMQAILERCSLEGKSIFLLGAEPDILQKCVENIKKRYPGIIVSGSHHGFFDLNNCENIVADIEKAEPYAIFIAMGCPRQEIFIGKYFDRLPCRLFMGVGGSFDVFAGKLKRAPRWMINLGIEWLYRVSKEPFRIPRLKVIPKFLLKVFYNTYIIKK